MQFIHEIERYIESFKKWKKKKENLLIHTPLCKLQMYHPDGQKDVAMAKLGNTHDT